MKIVYIARYLPKHGSITHIYSISKAMIAKNHEVHIMSGGPSDSGSAIQLNEAISYGIKHHLVAFPLKSQSGLSGKIKQLYHYITATPKALFTLFIIKPDVIHVHYPVTSYLPWIYKQLCGKSFITTHHTSGIAKHPLHKKADFVIAISSEIKQELETTYHYDTKQIIMIFNGVSTKHFCSTSNSNAENELKIPNDKVIIGFIGSFIYRKGIDILLNSVHMLNKQKYHLVLVGEGDTPWVLSMIQNLGLENNVTLYPYQDPVEFYELFDIFVLPSRKEGFPLVTIEAMMMGVPTIRSDVEGARDQINHGKDGYLFKNEDSQELSQYMDLLIHNKQLRILIGEKSKQKAIKEFSENNMINKLITVYERTE